MGWGGKCDYVLQHLWPRLWLRGEQRWTLTTRLRAFFLFKMQDANSCSSLCRKILTYISEPSNQNPSSFSLLWKSVKFNRLFIDDFATITVAKGHTTINYSSRYCLPSRHIWYVLTIASLWSEGFLVAFAFEISWERAILTAQRCYGGFVEEVETFDPLWRTVLGR